MTTSPRPFTFFASRHNMRDDDNARHAWRECAKKVEGLGYTSFHMGEHYTDIAGIPAQWWAPIPALMAVLDATSRLQVCAGFTPVAFHHPVVLAQEYATMDLLSEGRVGLGLGTGSLARDFQAAGVSFESHGARIRRLVEFIRVVRGCWGRGPFTFKGDFYSVEAIDGSPKPLQSSMPPVKIGAHGKKILSVAAREVDGINIAPGGPGPTTLPPDPAKIYIADAEAILAEKVGWIRDAAGARFSDIELGIRIGIGAVTNDRAGFVSSVASALGVTSQAVIASPYVVAGSAREIADQLIGLRERFGISNFEFPDPESFAPVLALLAGT